jgi:hypothetical protein
MRRWIVSIIVLVVALALAAPSDALVPAPTTIAITASPIFGADAQTGAGWTEIVVRVDNVSDGPQKGTVQAGVALGYGDSVMRFVARAPYAIPAGRSAIVRLPVHAATEVRMPLQIDAKNETGSIVATATLSPTSGAGPLLVDVASPSRIGLVMRTWPIATPWAGATTGPYGYYGSTAATQALNVGAPSIDRTTGDPIMPERSAGYAPVTVLLIHSDALVRLPPVELDALVGWVLAGGTLAVAPNRHEDLRSPVVSALAGGAVATAEVPPAMLLLPGQVRPGAPITPDPVGGLAPTPIVTPTPSALPGRVVPIHHGPTPAVRERLVGYRGGNLLASEFGASATYGTGEVHLLAFDPGTSPMLEDPWVHARLADMVARAWDRRAINAFPHGGNDPYMRSNDVRRQLDPNENFRPGLGLAAILLVIYSIVAGPLTFLRAAKKNKPLAPLKWAPMWSAAAFAAIVLVGLAGKGWRGRARHLSIVEAGAGAPRGAVRRFRGFFASETRSLSVPAADHRSVLDVTSSDSSSRENAVLRLDRNGATLEELTSLTWQTIVVREDGFMDLGGGVSIVPKEDHDLDVVNHSGRELKDVFAWAPAKGLYYLAKIPDGATARVSSGKWLAHSSSSWGTSTAGLRTIHPLHPVELAHAVSGKTGDPLGETWEAAGNAADRSTDWWPDLVPVVIGEMVGGAGPGRATDSGLALESDRVLFRIVGQGGGA